MRLLVGTSNTVETKIRWVEGFNISIFSVHTAAKRSLVGFVLFNGVVFRFFSPSVKTVLLPTLLLILRDPTNIR